jgi:hypothetical protein
MRNKGKYCFLKKEAKLTHFALGALLGIPAAILAARPDLRKKLVEGMKGKSKYVRHLPEAVKEKIGAAISESDMETVREHGRKYGKKHAELMLQYMVTGKSTQEAHKLALKKSSLTKQAYELETNYDSIPEPDGYDTDGGPAQHKVDTPESVAETAMDFHDRGGNPLKEESLRKAEALKAQSKKEKDKGRYKRLLKKRQFPEISHA